MYLLSPDVQLPTMCSFWEALWEWMSQVSGLHKGAARGGLCNCLPRWADYEPTVLGAMTESSFAAMGTYWQDLSASDSSKESENSLMGRHFSESTAAVPDVVKLTRLFRSQVSAEILNKKFLWDGSQCTSWQNSLRRGSKSQSHLWLLRQTVSVQSQCWYFLLCFPENKPELENKP